MTFDADINDKIGSVFYVDGRFYLLGNDIYNRIDHWNLTLIFKMKKN
jgi:hypothetical protein